MMKRLLVLILMLGLVSAANAVVVEFQVDGRDKNADGSYTATAGELLTINLYSDTALVGIVIGAVQSDNGGSMPGAVASEAMANIAGFNDWTGGYVENTAAGILFGLVAATESVNTYSGIVASFQYVVPANWNGSAITIAPIAAGSYYSEGDDYTYDVDGGIASLADSTNVAIGGLVLTPEPMTIALLGLGGLFLRRRK